MLVHALTASNVDFQLHIQVEASLSVECRGRLSSPLPLLLLLERPWPVFFVRLGPTYSGRCSAIYLAPCLHRDTTFRWPDRQLITEALGDASCPTPFT